MSSAAVNSAIDSLLVELEVRRAAIDTVRPGRAELAQSYQELLARLAKVRGRPALYPYVGSGLGNGALVELADGSVKLDLVSGIGVNFFGHSHPELTRVAVEAALSDTVKHGNLQCGTEPTEFAELLIGEAAKHSSLRYCFLSTSGTLANENALKLAFQKHAPASRVLAFAGCFMGRSTAMSQIGDSAANREGLPLQVLVDYMPFWDPAAAARMGKSRFIDMAVWHLQQYLDRYPKQHACFVFELVQGEGGFQVGDADFFRALMQVCRDRGVAVWDDEIQTFGRTESMFAYEQFGLGEFIDILTVGKMTQACATLYSESYNPRPGLLSGTFLGETVSFRVGQRVIELLRDGDFYGPDGLFAAHQRAFRQQVKELALRHPRWFPLGGTAPASVDELAHGTGGMMRMTPFGGQKDHIVGACKALFEAGVVAFWCGHDPYHIRLLPPLPVMEPQAWPQIFKHLEAGLAAYATKAGL